MPHGVSGRESKCQPCALATRGSALPRAVWPPGVGVGAGVQRSGPAGHCCLGILTPELKAVRRPHRLGFHSEPRNQRPEGSRRPMLWDRESGAGSFHQPLEL